MMSEAELHILQARMHEALLNKARRGELFILPPTGYVKVSTGEITLDPDEQAQSVIRLIFDAFDRLGSLRGVLRYLREKDVKIPIRPHKGPNKGMLDWRRASRDLVRNVLTHPVYAGTYRYGHRQVDRRRKKPGRPETGKVVVDPAHYHSLIHDHVPAYITRDRFDRNQKRIADNRNRANTKGAAREGEALLGGILFCGRCRQRMTVHYPAGTQRQRYLCQSRRDEFELPPCQSLSGIVLDELVTEKIMRALEPAALELSLQATDDLEKQRQQEDQDWRQRLERSRHAAHRAERQFQAVEPENRLVVRTLERQWESALQELKTLEVEYARFRRTHPARLSEKERELVRSLSENLPALWNASTTLRSDRQRIVRLLVDRVVIDINGSTEQADVCLHWSGGFTSHHELIRPVQRYNQMLDYDRMVDRMGQLRRRGSTYKQIAEHLNREGFHPAQQAKGFHKDIVARFFRKLRKQDPEARTTARDKMLGEDEWFAIDLARELAMPKNTLLNWRKRGWLRSVGRLPGYRGRIILWADTEELARLRRLRDIKRGRWDPPSLTELTTPKEMPRSC